MLVSVRLPPQARAAVIADVARFEAQKSRHTSHPDSSLRGILPTKEDSAAFRQSSIIRVAGCLCEAFEQLAKFKGDIPAVTDPKAIPPHITEQYYLPTLDQEQGTVRGNMEVLDEYLFKVLRIPKARLEREMIGVIGDRLTMARDRSAQEQRQLDRSTLRADRFS